MSQNPKDWSDKKLNNMKLLIEAELEARSTKPPEELPVETHNKDDFQSTPENE